MESLTPDKDEIIEQPARLQSLMSREEMDRQIVELSLRHIERSLLRRDHEMGLLEDKVDAIIASLHLIEAKVVKGVAQNFSTKLVQSKPSSASSKDKVDSG